MNHSLSTALRSAGFRGHTENHELMQHASNVLSEIELLMIGIRDAGRRDDIDGVMLRLQHIAKLIGCDNLVIERARSDTYARKQTSEMCAEGNI